MSKIFSLMGLLLVFMFATCVQPVSASQTKQESIRKAILYHSLAVSKDKSIFIVSEKSYSESFTSAYCFNDVSSCIAQDKEIRQPLEIYRNLCVFDLPFQPAKSFRTDRTVISVNHQSKYLRLEKVLAKDEPVTVFRSIPLLC